MILKINHSSSPMNTFTHIKPIFKRNSLSFSFHEMGISHHSEPTVHTMYVCIVEGESLLRSCVQSLPGERQYFNKIEHHAIQEKAS